MLNDIKKSLNQNQVVDMIYMSNDDKFTKRRIRPYKIKGKSVIAYCFLRRSTRTFNVDNVLAVIPVTTKESMVV